MPFAKIGDGGAAEPLFFSQIARLAYDIIAAVVSPEPAVHRQVAES